MSLSIVPIPGDATPPVNPPEGAAAPPGAALVVYAIEDRMSALVETLDAVPAELEAELLAEICAAINTVDGRDQMGRLLTHIEVQTEFAAAEVKRLQARKQMYERVLDRLEGFLTKGIQALGKDTKGKYPKLAGRAFTFGLKKLPPSVQIDDEKLVPSAYRKTTVKLSAALWERVLDEIPMELADSVLDEARRTDDISKAEIKDALNSGAAVPGAHLSVDGMRLEVK